MITTKTTFRDYSPTSENNSNWVKSGEMTTDDGLSPIQLWFPSSKLNLCMCAGTH